MPRDDKMPMKEFWDAVERQLAACSVEELRVILRALAQEIPLAGRRAFLDKLKPNPETTAAIQQAIGQEDLLADIDDFANELKTKMNGAEYWEEDHYEWGEHYDDEDSVGPYEEFVEPLTALFDRAEAAFDYGDLKLARAAYQKLFDVTTREDEYGRGIRSTDLPDVDSDEARARFLRAIYETTSPARRPQVLFEQMQQARQWGGRSIATLEDVIQISRKSLSNQEQFYEDWIAFLRPQKGDDADAWLREAIRLARGTVGLEELARKEGKKRPRAYLDWFTALEGEGKTREVLVAAQDALKILPAKQPLRAQVADHLCVAAEKLNETGACRAARWEAFLVAPTLVRLLDLWNATPLVERTPLMQQAAALLKNYLAHPPRRRETFDEPSDADEFESPGWVSASVLAHAHLLGEEYEAAHQLAAREKVLGWSGAEGSQGLVVSFFLVAASGKSPDKLPSNLKQLWQTMLENSSGFTFWGGAGAKEENRALKRLHAAYAERLETTTLSHAQQSVFLGWCLDVANKRVDAIVSEQHRGSYGKAAMLIAACAETLRSRGESKAADALLDAARNRFPRHRAFQSELDAAAGTGKRKR